MEDGDPHREQEGAWEDMPGLLVRFNEATASIRTGLFIGEGAYEGLVAVTELAWDLSGPRSGIPQNQARRER